jgi:MFS family permease
MFVAAGVVYLLRRLGYRLPIVVGSLVIAAGLLALGFEPPFGTPYVWLALGAGLTGIGMGIAMPAANNAALNLAPDRTAAVSGLRGMFRLAGAITGISVTTAVIAQSANPGVAQGHVFQVFAAVVVLVLPLAFLIKDHRGSW